MVVLWEEVRGLMWRVLGDCRGVIEELATIHVLILQRCESSL